MAYRAVFVAASSAALALSACLAFRPFACADETQCDREGEGVCLSGFCSYPDPACESQLRFEEHAGDDLAGQCVPVAGTGTGATATDTGGTQLTGSSTEGPDATSPGMTGPEASSGSDDGPPGCGDFGEMCCANDACEPGLQCRDGGCTCVSRVAVGDRHTCAAKLDGTVHCWGANNVAQLGLRDTESSPVPVQVGAAQLGAGTTTEALSAYNHTCALRSDGAVFCWGYNANGQVDPVSKLTQIPTPTIASWATSAIAAGAGSQHTCVSRDTGVSSTCWGGDNASGQLTGATMGPMPVDHSAGVEYAQIALGSAFTCGRVLSGAVLCWGDNAQGQLANDIARVPFSQTPIQALGLGTATMIAVGVAHGCAIVDGAVKCWGANGSGQLGDGTLVESAVPVSAGLPDDVVAEEIVAAAAHTCIRTSVGELYCWGGNYEGQLMLPLDENGNDAFTPTPTLIAVGDAIQTVSTSRTHTCVVSTMGQVLCWGSNEDGQLGDGTTNYGHEPRVAMLQCP